MNMVRGLVSVILFLTVFIVISIYQKKHRVVEKPAQVSEQPITVEAAPATLDAALASITAAEIKKNLFYLASQELEGRMSGKQGNKTAAEFIKKEYEKFGLPTEYQKFNIQRKNPGPKNEVGDDFTQNIFAWVEGTDPSVKDEIVVVGAHMDHIGYGPGMSRSRKIAVHPGADDNASGTVALLEIAQAFSMIKKEIRRTVVFQSYSAEEMGLIGSRYYCDHPTFPRNSPNINKHVFMLNMDMVGRLGNEQHGSFDSGESSIDISNIISQLNHHYSFARSITSRGSGGSDHASFYNKRIPVAFLHTGLHAHYHTPEDTPERVNCDGIEKISKYAFELAYQVAQAGNRPSFNTKDFKPMEYTHDHGHGAKFGGHTHE